MIRELSADEIASAAHLAAAALREDGRFAHVVPDDAARRYRLPALIESLLRAVSSAGGRVAGAFDEGALVGVSAIVPAGVRLPKIPPLACWPSLAWMLKNPSAVLRALALSAALDRLRPASPDQFRLLAVHPATQGRGIGAALLRDALKRGKTLYLEAFSPEIADWFEKRDFRRLAEVRATSRPTFWTLRSETGKMSL